MSAAITEMVRRMITPCNGCETPLGCPVTGRRANPSMPKSPIFPLLPVGYRGDNVGGPPQDATSTERGDDGRREDRLGRLQEPDCRGARGDVHPVARR